MMDYKLAERMPSSAELNRLRELVGWGTINNDKAQIGLDNSLFGVCIIHNGRVIAAARVVGDGHTVFYIQDVMVEPELQGNGLGSIVMDRIMNYVQKNACENAVVGLMTAKDRESFYEKYGFIKRPSDKYGCGMSQFWKTDRD